MAIVMKKRKARAVKFIVSSGDLKVHSKIFLDVTLSSMYDVMGCMRQTEQAFCRMYKDVIPVKWTYRELSENEIKSLNIGG